MPTKQDIEQWGLQRDTKSVPQLIKTLNTDAALRWDAAWALGQIPDNKRRSVKALIADNGLGFSDDPNIRKRAAYSLGEIGDVSALDALRQHREDADQYVQQGVEWAVGRLHEIIRRAETLVFGTANSDELNEETLLENPDLAKATVAMPNLRQLIVNAEDSDADVLGNFFSYAQEHLGQELRERINVALNGDFSQLGSNLSELQNLFSTIESNIEGLVFGGGKAKIPGVQRVLLNPPVKKDLLVTMPHLAKIMIHSEGDYVDLVDHFITYAENRLRPEPPQQKIQVSWHGELNENLRRNFGEMDDLFEVRIEMLVFGPKNYVDQTAMNALCNYDFNEEKERFPYVKKVLIHPEGGYVDLVDHFITYAENRLRPEPPQQKIQVSWHGELHENLRRNFEDMDDLFVLSS